MIISNTLIQADGKTVKRQIAVPDDYYNAPKAIYEPTLEERLIALEQKNIELDFTVSQLKSANIELVK